MQDHETDPTYLEALEWFIRMKDAQVSAEDRAAFETWFLSDPSHPAAYERARVLWERFGVVKPEYDRLRQSGRIGRRGMLLGGLAALVAAPSLYLLSRRISFPDYATGLAERLAVTLPDGSMVELGSSSSLSLDFSPQQRRVLLHGGQAFFRVAANAYRPFVVEAEMGSIQALGTEFNVKLATETVVVAVVEHSVKIRSASSAPVVLEAGWQVSYGSDGIAPAKRADLAAALAWRQDRIIVVDAPLRDVLTELERYRRGRILLMDSAIGDIPVTAVFDTRHTDNALRIIAETLPVRVINPSDYLAIVYPR